ncbi:MAG: ABC transporter substrate-binding protein [Bacteroidales bacterium]|jgi:iron complex transport system substrate-binding protein|nr:ABC transporter substrate-binding protein [Bacteroidales bacterium]
MKNYIRFLFFLLIISCHSATEKNLPGNIQEHAVEIKYAQGFSITDYNSYKLLTIYNPWQGAKRVEYRYALVHDKTGNVAIPDDAIKIAIPLQKVICLSTSHIAYLEVLDEIHSIRGVSGTKFVNNPRLLEKIGQDQIKDVGFENHLNYELITGMKPDVVITYGIGSEVSSYTQKLHDLGIETMIIPEYLETHPLGKLEWIKFIAALYDKEDKANAYFQQVEKEYLSLTEKVREVAKKPNVLFGLPWKDTWYVPGGNSFLAKMVEDAGGEYLWSSNASRESIPLDIENVFVKAHDADVWLNTGTVRQKEEILKVDDRFEDFKPFSKGSIYNNNKRENPWGGNDYWEKGTVEPHLILKDMIKIFHPELLPDHSLIYYRYID